MLLNNKAPLEVIRNTGYLGKYLQGYGIFGGKLTGCRIFKKPNWYIDDVFRVSIASSEHEGELGEFETVTQT